MLDKREILDGLAQCYGTEGYHYNKLHGKNFVYTDGIKFLLEACDAYWLLDAIFSYKKTEEFQVWKLEVMKDKTAVLTMKEDTNAPVLVNQKIHYTTFPLEEIEIWAVNDHNCGGEYGPVHVVLMLKTEN